jgi:hypothetical protein
MTIQEAKQIKEDALEVLADSSMADFHNIARKDLADADKVLQGSTKHSPASTKKRGRAAAFSKTEKPTRNKKPTRKTAKSPTQPSPQERANKPSAKKSATKKTDKAEKPNFSGSEVANFSAEQTFFIKVLAANGKQKTKEQLASMLRGYNKAAITQLIRAKSPNAKLLEEVATNLQAIHKDLKEGEVAKINFSVETLSKLNAFGKNQLQKMPSVALLTTFVGYQDKTPKKETAAKWVRSAKKISKTDTYFAQIQQAIDSVELYLAGGTSAVKLSVSQLRGLGALGFTCSEAGKELRKDKTSRAGKKLATCNEDKKIEKDPQGYVRKAMTKKAPQPPTGGVKKRGGAAKKSNLGCVDTQTYKPYWDKRSSTHDESGLPYMMSSKELLATKYAVLPMSDYWKKIFGDLPAEGRFNIALCAKKGQGKTTLAMRFAKYFANEVGSVLYLSNEQYGSQALKRQAEQNGITSADNITWCGSVDLLKELDLIKPNQYKLIIIDSTTDGQISKEMFESYLKKHKQTSFVAILRKSQQGTDMGADANFITGKVDVVVEFREEGNDKFAFWVKNRLANAEFLEENEVQIEMPK